MRETTVDVATATRIGGLRKPVRACAVRNCLMRAFEGPHTLYSNFCSFFARAAAAVGRMKEGRARPSALPFSVATFSTAPRSLASAPPSGILQQREGTL